MRKVLEYVLAISNVTNTELFYLLLEEREKGILVLREAFPNQKMTSRFNFCATILRRIWNTAKQDGGHHLFIKLTCFLLRLHFNASFLSTVNKNTSAALSSFFLLKHSPSDAMLYWGSNLLSRCKMFFLVFGVLALLFPSPPLSLPSSLVTEMKTCPFMLQRACVPPIELQAALQWCFGVGGTLGRPLLGAKLLRRLRSPLFFSFFSKNEIEGRSRK